MKVERTKQITDLLKPLVEVMGFELWGCELIAQGKHSVLRVYIDAQAGVTIDDCGRVSNQLSGILDVEDLIKGSYALEVSSPGMDRALFTGEQFARFVGGDVKIRLHQAIDGNRNFQAKIANVDDDKIVLIVDEKEIEVDITDIEKAKLIPEF